MKTDSIFYQLFLNLPESLFNLLKLPPELAQKYQFISQELKQPYQIIIKYLRRQDN